MKRLTAWKVWWKVLPLPGNGSLGRPTPTSCPQFGILTLKWLFNLWRWLTIYQSEDQSQSSKSSPRQRSSAGIHPDGDLGVNINMNYVITTHSLIIPLLSPSFHLMPLQYPSTPLITPHLVLEEGWINSIWGVRVTVGLGIKTESLIHFVGIH